MARRHPGRMPSMVTADKLASLISKPNSELVALRADIGSLMHVHGAAVNKLRIDAEAITAILHGRERPDLEVSDHAVVRWLEKVKGMDVTEIRNDIAAMARAAKANGDGETCRAKGDAVAYSHGDITFVVAKHNTIVTVVFGPYQNPLSAGQPT